MWQGWEKACLVDSLSNRALFVYGSHDFLLFIREKMVSVNYLRFVTATLKYSGINECLSHLSLVTNHETKTNSSLFN